MTDHQMDFVEACRNTYREVVAENSTADTAADFADSKAEAARRVSAMIADGEVLPPSFVEAAKREIGQADDKERRSTDRMIDVLIYGQRELDFDIDEAFGWIVTFGGGRRKPWRDVNRDDLDSMDELRFSNMQKQHEAYTQWRPKYLALRDGLERFGTTEGIVAAGALAEEPI